MVRVDYRVAIRRPPQDVFDYITRVEEFADWQHDAGVTAVRRLTPAPTGPGTRFVIERAGSRGGTAQIECEVTAFEPGRRFTFHGRDSDGFDSTFDTLLTPVADGTNLHWTVSMNPPNLLFRLLQPVIARQIRRAAAVDFPNLRARLESA
ncbi:MAG TPA: SRPBCC family protein [Candidatus Limnocylindrales bacterium]